MSPMTIRFFTELGHYGAKMGQIPSKLTIKTCNLTQSYEP